MVLDYIEMAIYIINKPSLIFTLKHNFDEQDFLTWKNWIEFEITCSMVSENLGGNPGNELITQHTDESIKMQLFW